MRISDWSSDVCSSDLPFYRPVDRRDWGCSWITDMESPRKLRNEEAGELVADQHETGGHQHGVGRESLACERIAAAPEPHRDEDRAERQQLPDLAADIERQEVGDQAITRKPELLQLGRQAEAMEE